MEQKKQEISFYRMTLAAFIAGSLIFHLAILWESRKEIAAGYGDFIIFYTGAQIINDGRANELYNVETQNAYQAKFDVPQLEWPLPFNHAPYELLLFLPLARLTYPLAHAIWSGMNVIFLALILRILLHYIDSEHRVFIGAAVLAWFPTMETLRLGQDSIMSTLLLLAVFVNLKRGREGMAGFYLALGLYKPQLVLPMAGVLLVARRWNSLAAFSFTGVMLAALSLAMVGWRGVFELISILRSMDNYSYIIYPANMSNIRGLSHLLFQGGTLERMSVFLIVIVSLGLYGYCLHLWRREFDALKLGFDLQFSLTVVTTVLMSYHLYPHDLFPLILALTVFFRYFVLGATTRQTTRIAFFLLIALLLLPVVPRYLIDHSSFGWTAVALLYLYACLAGETFRRCQIEVDGNVSNREMLFL